MRIDNATANLKIQEHLSKQETSGASEDFGKLLTDALKDVNSSQQ